MAFWALLGDWHFTPEEMSKSKRAVEFEHDHGLHVYLNDHPKDMAPETSPAEIAFRFAGLTSMLRRGLDFWW